MQPVYALIVSFHYYKTLNKNPIILLDDLFAKLDTQKCLSVLSLFNNKFQTIITTTDNAINPIIDQIKTNPILLEKKEKLCFTT